MTEARQNLEKAEKSALAKAQADEAQKKEAEEEAAKEDPALAADVEYVD
jgi:hypothetical protein